jgi:hypothetical protein
LAFGKFEHFFQGQGWAFLDSEGFKDFGADHFGGQVLKRIVGQVQLLKPLQLLHIRHQRLQTSNLPKAQNKQPKPTIAPNPNSLNKDPPQA